MDIATAFAVVKEIVSFVNNQQEEMKRKQQMKALLDNTDNLVRLTEAMEETIKHLLHEQTINDQLANLVNAQQDFQNGNLSSAETYAKDAAIRFMEPEIRVEAAEHFLAAAGAHITILTEWAKSDTNRLDDLKSRASLYAVHSDTVVVPEVIGKAAERITIKSISAGLLPYWSYRIDGQEKARRFKNQPSLAYFQGKRDSDAKALAAPVTYSLRMAAETWRAIHEGREPRYWEVFQNILITGIDPPLPWAYIVSDYRLHFAVAECASHFSKIVFPVPYHVFHAAGRKWAGDIVLGARVVGAPERPAAFIIKNGDRDGQIVKTDSAKAILANHSFIEQPLLAISTYDPLPHFIDLHEDPYLF